MFGYVEFKLFANAAMINGESMESIHNGIWCPTFFWDPRRMCKQCVPGPLLSFIGPGNEAICGIES